MQVHASMGAPKHSDEGIDAFEHAMRGVHTSNDHRIVIATLERGLIGSRSTVGVEDGDDIPEEREVIVRVRRPPSRPRR